MKLVNVPDGGHRRDQAGLQSLGVNVPGDGVEEDEDGLPEEGPGADTDEEDDDEGEDGVEIVFILPVSQPDHGGADQHHHAPQGVRQDVEEHALDIELLATSNSLLSVIIPLNIIFVMITMAMTLILDTIMALVITLDTIMAKYHQSNYIYEKPDTANHQQHLGVLNLLDGEEPLEGLEEDGEALGVEEDGVDESSDHLHSRPAEGADTAVSLGQSVVREY